MGKLSKYATMRLIPNREQWICFSEFIVKDFDIGPVIKVAIIDKYIQPLTAYYTTRR